MERPPDLWDKVQTLKDQLTDLQGEDPKLLNRFYLAHWLRASGYDIRRAVEAVKANRKWRRDNDIDALLDQEPDPIFWSKFPYFYDLKGKDPRHVVYIQTVLVDPPALIKEFGRDKTLRQMALALVNIEKIVYDWQNELESADDDDERVAARACGSLCINDTAYLTFKTVTSIQGLKLYVEWTKMGVDFFPSTCPVIHIINASRLIPFKLFSHILSMRGATLLTYPSWEEEYPTIFSVIKPDQLRQLQERAISMFPSVNSK